MSPRNRKISAEPAPPEDAPDPRHLESDVCDLVLMAKLAANHMEGVLASPKRGHEMVSICAWQAELAMFAVYQVANRAEALQADYYAAVYPGQGYGNAG